MAGAGALGTLLFFLAVGAVGAATITSFTPANGDGDTPGVCPGTMVVISGSGFQNGASVTSVMFNGSPSPFIQVLSDSTVMAVAPGNATNGPITVNTSGGSATSSSSFTIYPCQSAKGTAGNAGGSGSSGGVAAAKVAVTSFAPKSGKPGTKVTITGSTFLGTSAVKIGGAAASFTVVSPTKIVAIVGPKARAGKSGSISVSVDGGGTATLSGFTVK